MCMLQKCYLGVVDFLEALEHVEDSSLDGVLGKTCCGRIVCAVQSVRGML